MNKLESMGFDGWFQGQIDKEKLSDYEIARVAAVHKDSYLITMGTGDAYAELSGKLAYSAVAASDFPTTGDWVYAEFYDDNHAIIHEVVTRKTLIKRKTSGKSIDFQLIAANVDFAFIIQSVDFNFNLSRLERYLVMINESETTPVVLLSKCDLKTPQELNQIKESITNISPKTMVIPFSNISDDNIDKIKELLLPGHTYCLLGSSGVGKTSLLNNIIGSNLFQIQTVSNKESKGRHTTTSRELIQLGNGALIIDTPGMRELGNMLVDTGIDETFSEIIELSTQCKFRNCKHEKEKGCAVLSAIDKGVISEKRYQNYMKMKQESSFNEMSYYEKRQKDKDFGKLIKSTIKERGRK